MVDTQDTDKQANQFVMDARQSLCWSLYVDPKSETFGNAYQSALKAKYDETTANTITTAKWFIIKLRRLNMLNKAEKKLDETLDYDPEISGEIDTQLLKIQTDVAKHLTATLGKNEGYSTKSEVDHTSGGLKIEGFNYILPTKE